MSRARCFAAIIVGLSLFAPLASAQDDEGQLPAQFTSDRPGFANSTLPAARGRLTTEMGVNVQIAETTIGDLPNLWLRTGLFEWLEARVRAPNAVGIFADAGNTFGLTDAWLGFKAGGRLADTVSASTDWEVSLPIGTDGFGAGEAQFRADAQLAWRFFGPLSVTPNAVALVRVDRDAATGELVHFFQGGGSLKVAWQILDVLTVFAQSVVLASDRRPLSVIVGGGIYGRVLPNVQLDASFNAGTLTDDLAPTVSAGTTILF